VLMRKPPARDLQPEDSRNSSGRDQTGGGERDRLKKKRGGRSALHVPGETGMPVMTSGREWNRGENSKRHLPEW